MKVVDFFKRNARVVIDKDFLNNGPFTLEQARNIQNIMNKNRVLSSLWSNNRLYVGGQYRLEAEEIVTRSIKYRISLQNQLNISQQVSSIFSGDNDFGSVFASTMIHLEERCEHSNSQVEDNVLASLETLYPKTFGGVSIELYPSLVEGAKGSIGRTALYYLPPHSRIDYCPVNYPIIDGLIPAIFPFYEGLTHELGHGVDLGINNGQSAKDLGEILQRHFDLSTADIREVLSYLEYAAKMYNPDFFQCYDLPEIVQNGRFNSNAAAASEFVSFFAELIGTKLVESSSLSSFQSDLAEYLKNKIRDIARDNPNASALSRLFAVDALIATSSKYISIVEPNMDKGPLKGMFRDIRQRAFVEARNLPLSELATELESTIKKDDLRESLDSALKEFADDKIRELEANDPDLYSKNPNEVLVLINDPAFVKTVQGSLLKDLISKCFNSSLGKKAFNALDKNQVEFTALVDRISQSIYSRADKPIASNSSYVENAIMESFLKAKAHYMEENSTKIQQHLAELAHNLTDTSDEINRQNVELQDVEKLIEKDPNNKSLEERRNEIAKALEELKDREKRLEKENDEVNDKNERNNAEREDDAKEQERREAERKRQAEKIFEGK